MKAQKAVAKQISTAKGRQMSDACSKAEALARELGYSLAKLAGTETSSFRVPAALKYRNPQNPSLIWSGRGRKPRWFVDALEAGNTSSNLAIR